MGEFKCSISQTDRADGRSPSSGGEWMLGSKPRPEGTARRARSTSGDIPVPSQATPPASPAQGRSRAQACNNPSKPETCSPGCLPLSAAVSAERGRDRLELLSFPSSGAFPLLPRACRATDPRAAAGIWVAGHQAPGTRSQEQLRNTALKQELAGGRHSLAARGHARGSDGDASGGSLRGEQDRQQAAPRPCCEGLPPLCSHPNSPSVHGFPHLAPPPCPPRAGLL